MVVCESEMRFTFMNYVLYVLHIKALLAAVILMISVILSTGDQGT